MVVADLVRAAALVAAAAGIGLDRVGFVALVALALVMGAGEVAFDLASFAVLPSVVDGAALERANGRLFAVQTGGRDIVGHLAGGVLITVSRVWPFVVDAVSFVASAALLWRVPDPPVAPRQQRRLRDEVREGITYLFRDRMLRALALAAGAVNAVHLGQIAVLPLFALHRLHLPVSWYGGLLAMSSVGGIAGGLLAERATRWLRRDRLLVAGVALLALQSLAIGAFPTAAVAFAGFFVAGVAMMAWNVVAVSIRQAAVPSSLLGRVGSVYRLISWGTMPVGGVVFGALATRYGPTSAFAVGGVVMLVVALSLAAVMAHGLPDRAASMVVDEIVAE
jgi:MFS family permease